MWVIWRGVFISQVPSLVPASLSCSAILTTHVYSFLRLLCSLSLPVSSLLLYIPFLTLLRLFKGFFYLHYTYILPLTLLRSLRSFYYPHYAYISPQTHLRLQFFTIWVWLLARHSHFLRLRRSTVVFLQVLTFSSSTLLLRHSHFFRFGFGTVAFLLIFTFNLLPSRPRLTAAWRTFAEVSPGRIVLCCGVIRKLHQSGQAR